MAVVIVATSATAALAGPFQPTPSAAVVGRLTGQHIGNPTEYPFRASTALLPCAVCTEVSHSQTPLLTVAVTASPLTSPQDTLVNFSATASGGAPPYTYRWSFGDGASSSVSSSNTANHSYLAVGLYLAVVNVSDGAGGVAQGWVQVHTTPGFGGALTAVATANIYEGTGPLNVTFTGQALNATGQTPYYEWSFSTSWGTTPSFCGANESSTISHTFVQAGLYEVALCVSTIFSGSQSAFVDVLVKPPVRYAVTFTETGLPASTQWAITGGLPTQTSTGSTISFYEANGSYPYAVGTVAGYTSSPSSGIVMVSGGSKNVAIAFTKVNSGAVYTVTFTENDLPSGTSWSVALNGTTKSSTTNTITFQETNGSYGFAVVTVSGYAASPSTGTVKVNGGSAGQTITFASSLSTGKTNQTTGFLGLPGFEGYILIGGIVAVVATGALILLLRKRSPPRGSGSVQDSKNIADGAASQVAVE